MFWTKLFTCLGAQKLGTWRQSRFGLGKAGSQGRCLKPLAKDTLHGAELFDEVLRPDWMGDLDTGLSFTLCLAGIRLTWTSNDLDRNVKRACLMFHEWGWPRKLVAMGRCSEGL